MVTEEFKIKITGGKKGGGVGGVVIYREELAAIM